MRGSSPGERFAARVTWRRACMERGVRMTNECPRTNESPTPSAEPEPPDPDPRADWFLAELVRRANEAGLCIGVTLNVGGILVSGTLVGGHRYFEGFAEDVAAASPDAETAGRARAFFRSPAAMYRSDARGAREVAADPEPLAYVHLEDARFFGGAASPIPRGKGVYWRGKLSAVDGFALGVLDPSCAPSRGE